jgi:peptide/nickel transport system substrate-binding protein
LASGAIDIANPSGSKMNIEEMKRLNIEYSLIDNAGYGYVGLQANNLPLAVRKGLLTLLNREPAVKGWYGDIADVIERPMTTVLAEYPDDAKVYYSYDVETALKYFESAGYAKDASGKLVDKNANRLVVNAYIGGSGKGDHPAYSMLTQAQNDMASLGGELQIQDVEFNVLQGAMNDGTADMFILAWGNTTTCDKSSIYSTGGGQNRTNVSDPALDELLRRIPLTIDFEERSGLVSQMLDKVMDLAIELPLYQRKNITAYGSNLNMDTVPEAGTFWSYESVLYKVELKSE